MDIEKSLQEYHCLAVKGFINTYMSIDPQIIFTER